jgi:hypothetical protein
MCKKIGTMLMLATLAAPMCWARGQAAREATIQPDTKALIVLQSRLSSKLSEVGDPITGVLDEAIVVDGLLVMPRGTEFHGRVTSVKPARRGQKGAQMTIVFDRVAMPWGEEPVAILITAIDDWSRDRKLRANDEGKVNGGHDGDKTVDNVERGGVIGGAGAGTIILAGAAAGSGPGVLGAGAAAIGAGMLGGLLLTKGSEVRLDPGVTFRVKFVKPMTLPVIQQPGVGPRPIQQDDDSRPADPKKPGSQQ